jgi:hypothetical protein
VVPRGIPPAAHADYSKCILRDVLKVCSHPAQIGVGGVGICKWRSRIIYESGLDISEYHGERKNPNIYVEEALLLELEAGRDVVDMIRKVVSL